MKIITKYMNQKTIVFILSASIILILLVLGFSFPKGIYGIKPVKVINYFVKYSPNQSAYDYSSGSFVWLSIFLIVLLVLSIIYLIFHPFQFASYLLAIIFIIGIFLIIPKLFQISKTIEETPKQEVFENTEKQEIFLENQQPDKIKVVPLEENENKKSNYTLIIILLSLLIIFSIFVVAIFLVKLISRIIKEIKNGEFYLFSMKDKNKKIFISEIKKVLNETIQLIKDEDNLKSAIINCYIALLYSVKKYAKESKDPSYTCREFIPTFLSIGLELNDIDTITQSFEKAKYSKNPITKEEKDIVIKSLKNCILKLKKIKKS